MHPSAPLVHTAKLVLPCVHNAYQVRMHRIPNQQRVNSAPLDKAAVPGRARARCVCLGPLPRQKGWPPVPHAPRARMRADRGCLRALYVHREHIPPVMVCLPAHSVKPEHLPSLLPHLVPSARQGRGVLFYQQAALPCVTDVARGLGVVPRGPVQRLCAQIAKQALTAYRSVARRVQCVPIVEQVLTACRLVARRVPCASR